MQSGSDDLSQNLGRWTIFWPQLRQSKNRATNQPKWNFNGRFCAKTTELFKTLSTRCLISIWQKCYTLGKAHMRNLQGQMRQWQDQMRHWPEKNETLTRQMRHWYGKMKHWQDKMRNLQGQMRHWQDKWDTDKKKWDIDKTNETLTRQNETLTRQNEKLTRKNETLTRTNETLTRKIETLTRQMRHWQGKWDIDKTEWDTDKMLQYWPKITSLVSRQCVNLTTHSWCFFPIRTCGSNNESKHCN